MSNSTKIITMCEVADYLNYHPYKDKNETKKLYKNRKKIVFENILTFLVVQQK